MSGADLGEAGLGGGQGLSDREQAVGAGCARRDHPGLVQAGAGLADGLGGYAMEIPDGGKGARHGLRIEILEDELRDELGLVAGVEPGAKQEQAHSERKKARPALLLPVPDEREPVVDGVARLGCELGDIIQRIRGDEQLAEGIALHGIYYAHTREVFRRDGMLLAVHEFMQPAAGEEVFETSVRFRTVGDVTCTGCVESDAVTVDEVIAETALSRLTERGATRADDRISEAGMEDRKREGYF